MEPTSTTLPKGIGQPATRALAAVGVSQLEDLTRFSESELLALHGFGPKALGFLTQALRAEGKDLAERP